MKQVDKSHYDFERYHSPYRFTSYFYQLQAIRELLPDNVLEIGVGDHTFQTLAKQHGINAYGMDLDPELSPSLCASATQIPLFDASIDAIAAFQVLEHLPYNQLPTIAGEMHRVCRKGVAISLPEFGNASLVLNIPMVRHIAIPIARCSPIHPEHRFDGEHHWEIGKRGFPLNRIIATFRESGLACKKTWINPYFAYHRFFVFRKAAP
jgi:predicted SAM-dependent methyltransferase